MKKELRNMSIDDVPSVLALLPRFLGGEYTNSIFKDDTSFSLLVGEMPLLKSEMHNNTLCLVEEFNAQIIGILACQAGKHTSTLHTATIYLYTDTKLKEHDLARNLLDRAVQWARDTRTIKRLQTQISSRNNYVIQLLKEYGFEVEATLRDTITIGDKYYNSLVMALIL